MVVVPSSVVAPSSVVVASGVPGPEVSVALTWSGSVVPSEVPVTSAEVWVSVWLVAVSGVPPAVIWKVWLIKPLPSGWIEMSGPSSHVCWTKFNEFLRCVSGSVMEEGCPPAPQGSYSVCLVVDCWWFVTVDLEVSRLQHNPAERI